MRRGDDDNDDDDEEEETKIESYRDRSALSFQL